MDSFRKTLKKLLKVTTNIAILDYIEKPKTKNLEIVFSIQVPEEEAKEDTIIEQRLLSCRQCDYSTKDKEDLKKHFHSHPIDTIRKRYQCDQCPWSFNQRIFLKQHQDMIHNAVKQFACPCCAYESYKISNIRRHLRRVHPMSGLAPIRIQNNEKAPDGSKQQQTESETFRFNEKHPEIKKLKTLVCHLCVWLFDKPYKLDKHIAIVHDGKKRYKCPASACGYKSFLEISITRHIETQHPDLEASPIMIYEFDSDHENLVNNEASNTQDFDDEILAIFNEAAEKSQPNGDLNKDLNEEMAVKRIRKLKRKIKRKWTEAGLSSESKWKEAKRLASDFPETDRYKAKDGDLKTLWKEFKTELLESDVINFFVNDLEGKRAKYE